MKTFKQFNTFTKTMLIAGLLLVVYGYSCRLFRIYFFWESKSAGWMLFFIGIIGFLFYCIKIKKTEKKKAIPEKIGIGILCFILFVQLLLMIVLPFTDAYNVAKIYIEKDADLRSEIGTVTGFGLISTGEIEEVSDMKTEVGSATISLTVKGDKKFKDITIYVIKEMDSPDWKVEEME